MPAADYSVTLEVQGLKEIEGLIDPKRLASDLSVIHRKLAFMSLAHAIRTCSVDTGRARAGFLALFRKHGVSAENAMRRPPPGGSSGKPDPKAIADGSAKGSVHTDRPFEIVVGNAVEYVEFINSGTSKMMGTNFLDKTMLKTLEHSAKVVDWYMDAILTEGRKLEQDPRQGPGEIPS